MVAPPLARGWTRTVRAVRPKDFGSPARAGMDPEWGGQEVEFRLEEDAYFDGQTVSYLDGRQSAFHLIGAVPAPRRVRR